MQKHREWNTGEETEPERCATVVTRQDWNGCVCASQCVGVRDDRGAGELRLQQPELMANALVEVKGTGSVAAWLGSETAMQ